VYCTYPLP